MLLIGHFQGDFPKLFQIPVIKRCSEKCIGCGVCRNVCPCRNITIENKRPVYHHRCIGCNACVVYCPRKAIQFSTPEAYQKLDNVISNRLKLPEKRKRYHHPNVSAKDLMRNQEKVGSEN